MASRYPRFDRSQLKLRPLSDRENLLDLTVMQIVEPSAPVPDPQLCELAEYILTARERGAPVILMMGAHVIRAGVSPHLIQLLEEGMVTHIAMNGAGPIHDYEFALIGATTESVSRYISEGQFGLWRETGELLRILAEAPGLGFGEAVGREILDGPYPYKQYSILAAGHRLGIPVTVHVGIGYDIIHEHPQCDGAILGRASYEDFLIFAEAVRHLSGGVVLNFGSATMGPEVFLKALAMARNVAHQRGTSITDFTTAVFDLVDLGEISGTEPPRNQAQYYFRPLKTLLLRTIRDGGRGFYFRGPHQETVPALYAALKQRGKRKP
jgi:hypothetical protein